MPWDDETARQHVTRTEELLSGLDGLPDHASAARAQEAVQALVDLYGECLARVMEHLADWPQGTERIAGDELLGHLLLVHDLHPDPPGTRVEAALAEVRTALADRGGEVTLLHLEHSAVRLRLTEGGAGHGCGCGSAEPPEDMVRAVLGSRVPEIERIDIETVPAAPPQALIPADSLFRRPAPVAAAPATGDGR
ncbi:NifU family protein [Streptomyces sp. NPDC018031]|uniref:NifU family protein n=1 Tax=Streptomyces sp. NPDC018031 TaxID=3365033 RepID=UPI0037B3537F